MATQYHVYHNDSAGGPVDFSTVVATTASLTWTSPALAFPGDHRFALRAFDTVTGLEEKGVAATARLVLDASGVDVTGRPNAPTGLTATPGPAGSVRVAWAYNPGGQGGKPTGFHVYVGTPTPSFGAPAATVLYVVGRSAFGATVTGLAAGAYQTTVRAYNATGEETNAAAVSFTASSTGPTVVDSLIASP